MENNEKEVPMSIVKDTNEPREFKFKLLGQNVTIGSDTVSGLLLLSDIFKTEQYDAYDIFITTSKGIKYNLAWLYEIIENYDEDLDNAEIEEIFLSGDWEV